MESDFDAIVYVVDDDDAGRASLQYLIESVGVRTVPFADPNAFLADFDENAIGCIVFDMRLPTTSGLELLRKLRQRGAKIPVIMISAYASVQDAVTAMRSGACDFFKKPPNDEKILSSIQQSITDHRSICRSEREIAEIRDRLQSLTTRERDILGHVIAGVQNKEIARHMRLSSKTVEAYRSSMMKKMRTPSVAQLVRMTALVNLDKQARPQVLN